MGRRALESLAPYIQFNSCLCEYVYLPSLDLDLSELDTLPPRAEVVYLAGNLPPLSLSLPASRHSATIHTTLR